MVTGDEGSNIIVGTGVIISMTQNKKPTELSDDLKPSEHGSGQNLQACAHGASTVTATRPNPIPEQTELMEKVVTRANMLRAYDRVMSNKGAAGIDKMIVDELMPYLKEHWERIKAELLGDRYKPHPVREVEIPKPEGGMRKLGIPTVIDRLIQQALQQVLSPYFEENFSESSHGFRPGRSTHGALRQAQEYVQQGKRIVVDIDLEKFFDRVNHDVLMSRVARVVKDKRVLRLLRRYLQSGIMTDGMATIRREGTPQGSPLSPLLSNILLDDLDKELERPGHSFVRYADDCNIYVSSRRAGERVMESVTKFLSKHLRLKVNTQKSAVDRVWKRNFLGYSMTWAKRSRLKVSGRSVTRLKDKVRDIFKQSRGQSLDRIIDKLTLLLRGWMQYFRLATVKNVFDELDGWIRRKLRCVQWQHWKHWRRRAKELVKHGLRTEHAYVCALNGRGSWFNAGASHMNLALPKKFFDDKGLVSLLDLFSKFHNQ
jgi:RNA-directed DNA polymerase